MEKQRDKAARRMQRRLDKQSGKPAEGGMDDLDNAGLEPGADMEEPGPPAETLSDHTDEAAGGGPGGA